MLKDFEITDKEKDEIISRLNDPNMKKHGNVRLYEILLGEFDSETQLLQIMDVAGYLDEFNKIGAAINEYMKAPYDMQLKNITKRIINLIKLYKCAIDNE